MVQFFLWDRLSSLSTTWQARKPAPQKPDPNSCAPVLVRMLQTQRIRGAHGVRVHAVQRGQKSRVNVRRRDDDISERKRSRRTRVMHYRAPKTVIECSACRRIDTHVGHHSRYDEMADFPFRELIEQPSAPETVRKILANHDFTGHRLDIRVDPNPRRVRKKKRCARAD